MEKDDIKKLVLQAAQGNKAAFGALYEETGRTVYFSCLKLLGDPQLAEDITQETYLTALQKLGTLAQPENFPAWVNRIGINLCKMHFRNNSAPEDNVSGIYWGDTREEVYEQCKDIIHAYWKPEYEQYGTPQELFIKSVTFIEAKLSDNVKLMSSDPTYLANLVNQSDEQRARDLDGNWKYKAAGDDIIKLTHMEALYRNSMQIGDGIRRVSCDAAFEGGDSLVMWLWEGWHIRDIFVCKLDSKKTVDTVKAMLEEWHVREECFTYDLNGLGQIFKGFFPNAIPFNNKEAVEEKFKYIYANLKSQAAYLFAQKIINREISIEPTLLERKFSGKGFEKVPLRQILDKERKAIRKDEDSEEKGWTIIKKIIMKKLVGHSPDFIEALLMRMIFEIKHKRKHIKGLGLI